jgi:tetratricopeptide (TPR) repeat protein
MLIGFKATSRNGWFRGRCPVLLFLCNKYLSKDFSLMIFEDLHSIFCFTASCWGSVLISSLFAWLLPICLYTQLGMVSPQDAPSHLYKGITLQELQRYDEALAAEEQAIFLDPTNARYHCYIRAALVVGKSPECVLVFPSIVVRGPECVLHSLHREAQNRMKMCVKT